MSLCTFSAFLVYHICKLAVERTHPEIQETHMSSVSKETPSQVSSHLGGTSDDAEALSHDMRHSVAQYAKNRSPSCQAAACAVWNAVDGEHIPR